MAKERAFEPQRLDIAAFAEAAGDLTGSLAQAALPRLSDSLLVLPGDAPAAPVTWSAHGEQRPVKGGAPEVWLHLQAHTQATLQCQRCLQALGEAVEVDRWFRFVADEDEALRLDEESEDDVLVLSRSLDLLDLLEDELILALPLVPMHGECPAPLPMQAGDDTVEEAAPNPFAALAALRKPGGKP